MKRLPSWSLAMAGVLALTMSLAMAAGARADATSAGSVTGKVVDSSGQPVAGAMVRIMMLPPMEHHRGHGRHERGHRRQQIEPGQTVWHHQVFGITRTADDGSFTINNAEAGRYMIVAMKRGTGFGRIRRPITVSGGGAAVDAGTITLHERGHHNGRRHHPPPGH